MFKSLKTFASRNYIWVVCLIILAVAAYVRLFRIEDYLTFLGDEGRDVLIVRNILHGHLTFLGPRASAADFFTGPIYYYMMAPFLFLSNYNPVGPAIMIALFGVATVYLIFRFAKEWFGTSAAVAASVLYAIAPLVIAYSRSSWNPNPMPFFSLLILYLLYKFVQKPRIIGFLIIGVLYGVAFQLHYIEVFVGIIILSFIFLANRVISRKGLLVRLAQQYISILVGFIFGLSPFLVFEIKHGFPNTHTIVNFIFHPNTTGEELIRMNFFQRIWDVFFRLFGRLVFYYPEHDHAMALNNFVRDFWQLSIVLVAFASIIVLLKSKNRILKLLLSLWLFFGVVLFGFYHKAIYDYYFEFMFPLPFLLVGNLFSFIYSKGKPLKAAVIVGLLALLLLNWLGNPFRFVPNQQYHQVRKISEFILDKAGNKPFNFALLTLGNSDHAYRYIFEIDGKPPVEILNPQTDPQRKSVTNQLFVVCEDPNCEPEGASLWEVAGFGRAKIVDSWPVSVLRVYKLEHYTGK